MRELKLLIGVELKEYWREPGIIFWAILFPILLALGLGLAFSGSSSLEKKIAVICPEGGCSGQELYKKIEQTGTDAKELRLGNEKVGWTTYQFEETSWDDAVLMLKRGKVSMILELKPGGVQYHFDPANAEAKFSYQELTAYFNGSAGNEEEVTVLRQSGTRYVDFLVPGLMAMGIMMSCMWGISYSNVEKRNKKLLRRMVATPMKKYNYMISQFVSRVIMSAVEASLLVAITSWIFDIQITGSFLALVLLFLAGNMTFTGLAVMIASRTSNTQIANGLINLAVMPMMILSGIYFSYHNFPDFMVAVIRLLPLTILADGMRSVFIEGAGLMESLGPIAILVVLGTLLLAVGIRVYKWY